MLRLTKGDMAMLSVLLVAIIVVAGLSLAVVDISSDQAGLAGVRRDRRGAHQGPLAPDEQPLPGGLRTRSA